MPPAPAPARLEETATFLSKPPRSAQLMATLLSSTGPRAGPVTRHLISRVPSTEPGASARCGRSDGVRWPCEDSGVRPPRPPQHLLIAGPGAGRAPVHVGTRLSVRWCRWRLECTGGRRTVGACRGELGVFRH